MCEADRIEIRIDPANEASLGVPRRIGCAYRLSAYSAAPGFDDAASLPGDVMARFFEAP